MAFNLTPTSAVYNTTTAKFGQSLKTGFARGTSALPTSGAFTVECWVKGVGSGTEVAVGQLSCFWLGKNSNGQLRLSYGNGGTEITLLSTVNADNTWRHLEADYDPSTGMKFFVDGVLAASSTVTMSAAGATYANQLEVKTFASGAFTYAGEVDEVAIWSVVQHTAAFTPRTAAISGDSSGLRALYHFDGDTLDSAVAAAVTLPGAPTIGTATAGAGTATVTFTAGTAGTNPTTSYIATASTGEAATGTASPIAFSSLSVGTARTIHVQAISIDGTGPASAESNSVTPTASSDTTPPTLTGAVTLGTPASTSIAASWPTGADNVGVTGYEYSINGGTSYVSVGNVTSVTISGLTPATTYPQVRLRAFDAAGLRSAPYISSSNGFTTCLLYTSPSPRD